MMTKSCRILFFSKNIETRYYVNEGINYEGIFRIDFFSFKCALNCVVNLTDNVLVFPCMFFLTVKINSTKKQNCIEHYN